YDFLISRHLEHGLDIQIVFGHLDEALDAVANLGVGLRESLVSLRMCVDLAFHVVEVNGAVLEFGAIVLDGVAQFPAHVLDRGFHDDHGALRVLIPDLIPEQSQAAKGGIQLLLLPGCGLNVRITGAPEHLRCDSRKQLRQEYQLVAIVIDVLVNMNFRLKHQVADWYLALRGFPLNSGNHSWREWLAAERLGVDYVLIRDQRWGGVAVHVLMGDVGDVVDALLNFDS